VIALWLVGVATGASLDVLEVGGPYGTPSGVGGEAAWWNPAGFACGEGMSGHVEVAPTFGGVTFERADPNGGSDEYLLSGFVPYVGLTHDLGQENFGFGAAFTIPYARGGDTTYEDGTGRYHLRDGHSRALYGLIGAAWRPVPEVAVGGVLAVVHNRWSAYLDMETLPDLEHAIHLLGEQTEYDDTWLEDPHYAARVETQGDLTDTRMTFGLGARIMPDPGGRVVISATYHHGVTVVNTGEVRMLVGEPREDDEIGAFGSASYGLSNQILDGQMSVTYRLPSRLHLSVAVAPIETLRLELMGGWTGWSVYTDFEIEISGMEENEGVDPEAAALVNTSRLWARDNQNTVWGALDVKFGFGERWTLGGRATLDRAAVPDHALSPNNYDANTLVLSAMGALQAHEKIQIVMSFSHHFVQDRVVEDSAFGVTLEGDRNEDRWYYPHANGTYEGWVERAGIALRFVL